jgi:hypothetical protein
VSSPERKVAPDGSSGSSIRRAELDLLGRHRVHQELGEGSSALRKSRNLFARLFIAGRTPTICVAGWVVDAFQMTLHARRSERPLIHRVDHAC